MESGEARYYSLPSGAPHRQIVASTQPSESSVGAILKALPLPFLLPPCSVLLFVLPYDQAPSVLSSGPEMVQEGLGVDIKPEFGEKRTWRPGLWFFAHGRPLNSGFLLEIEE